MKSKQLIGFVLACGALAVFMSTALGPQFEDTSTASTSVDPEIEQVANSPSALAVQSRRSATLRQRNDGHYWARALVNRKSSIEFLVDTGASVVALNYRDAQRMGLNPDALDYKWRVQTAGGETFGASVMIDSIKINQIHIRNVEAMVLRTDMETSLLGMSFLNQLYSYEFRGDRLIFKQ